MRAVKGLYENGVVSLLDPVEMVDRQEVTVLIPERGDAQVSPALRFAGMLRDLTPEEEAAFDEAIKRPVAFGRDVAP